MPTMKLSEAIREGAKLSGQTFGEMLNVKDGRTCALGAACYGANLRYIDLASFLKHFSEIPTGCVNQIIEWNDTKRLTREQIADRLEGMGY